MFPLLAVAEALRALEPSPQIVFVGTHRGMEATLLPARGERLEFVEALPLKGQSLMGGAKGLGSIALSFPRARHLVKQLAPDVVLSLGGYAAGTVSVAAWSAGVPVTLLEANATLGLSNRLLRPFVRRAFVVFPETVRDFAPSVACQVGMPLRAVFQAVPYERSSAGVHVLVLGGSQGATPLNEIVPRALARLRSQGRALSVIHQAGRGKDDAVRALYQSLQMPDAQVTPFIDDVATALGAAQLVIARSGAGSVGEISAVGRPAVLIPFPHAADDHQTKNARSLEHAGGALCVLQKDASEELLAAKISALLEAPEKLAEMASASARFGSHDAASQVARELVELAKSR